MIGGFRALFAAAMLALGAFSAVPATAGVLQCAPFAREVSGIEIFGNANTWWNQAAGRYDRGHEPRVGAVLSFASSRSMPVGHVSTSSPQVRLNIAAYQGPGTSTFFTGRRRGRSGSSHGCE